MSSSGEEKSDVAGDVSIQLLDAALGRPVKTWKFSGLSEITIGRRAECDVEISDAYVSRLHAELRYRDGAWTLAARGRSGVVVRNQQITELVVQSGVAFQLGPGGPLLRFQQAQQESLSERTLCFDEQFTPFFTLDESKLENEVGQIAEGDYFQKLQAQAQALRARRQA